LIDGIVKFRTALQTFLLTASRRTLLLGPSFPGESFAILADHV